MAGSDTGGYLSGEILASNSESESEGDDECVQALLKRAESIVEKYRPSTSSRKRPVVASDESEAEESECTPPDMESTRRSTNINTSKKKKSSKNFFPPKRSDSNRDFRSLSSTQGSSRGTEKTPSRKFRSLSVNSTSSSLTRSKYGGKIPVACLASDSASPTDTNTPIITTLKEISNTLSQVVSRMDKQEYRIESMERKIAENLTRTPSSTGSSSAESSSKKVPALVRSELRSTYRILVDEDREFCGYNTDLGISFKDEVNVKVTDKLVREVKSSNPSFQTGVIRAAAYTYYRSLCQESSLERRGIKPARDKQRRRRERVIRKLNNRVSTLKKSDMSDKDKTKWMSVLVPEFVSSDYSCSDSEDDHEQLLVTQPLEWRAQKVTDFFYQLDQYAKDSKSAQARKQTKTRVLSDTSSMRSKPSGRFPSWAIVGQAM